MNKKIIIPLALVVAVSAVIVIGGINWVKSQGIQGKFTIQNWYGNLVEGENNIEVADSGEPILGGFETGKVNFSNLSEGVLQSTRVFISSASFGTIDTTQITLLASSSTAPGTAGAKINELIGITIESNPVSESYNDAFGGFWIYAKDPVLANVVASAGNFVALGSGSIQRTMHTRAGTCSSRTSTPILCTNAGAYRNIATSSAFYLRQGQDNPTFTPTGFNMGGDTSFWVTVYYRVYETLSGF